MPDHNIVKGPFKGMKYASFASVGSTLGPKLLGSYEAELHPIIEKICQTELSTIIDTGCAEGYYVVGFALRMPEAKVYAFDIDETARKLCKEMSVINHVSDRVFIDNKFSLDKLNNIECKNRQGLIISDCEGAEASIFDSQSIYLKTLIENYDLLIEVHEHLKPGTSEYLKNGFSASHKFHSIYSIDDISRPMKFPQPILIDKPYNAQVELMAEQRYGKMEWIYFYRE